MYRSIMQNGELNNDLRFDFFSSSFVSAYLGKKSRIHVRQYASSMV